MRNAETVLSIIRERGERRQPVERVYRHLFNRELYLLAYSKLYANDGAMTPGVTAETVDGMSLSKIDAIIEALRFERYHWTPVRRTYIPKKNRNEKRPLGIPTWSDKLLQEAIRLLLAAYYEPQFSEQFHGFRSGYGCHTALHSITRHWRGIKWFIEGDIKGCFTEISHTLLLDILREKIADNRFIRLIRHLLEAGYLQQWQYNPTYSGIPQGSIIGPIFTNLVLDRLDQFVMSTLKPQYTRGRRRKTNPPYVALTKAASTARKSGDRQAAEQYNQQAQAIPSRDPNDPNFRRLHYVRYADDWLIGYVGTKAEAKAIKQRIACFLRGELHLELNKEKTLITHARDDFAHFLGYEIHTLHANDKHDHRGQRCINGAIGLRVPRKVVRRWCAKYMRKGKPIHLVQRVNDSVLSIIAQYQTEYLGVVQYYRLAYNLHQLGQLKYVMEVSLTKTLAQKLRATRNQIYKRFSAYHKNEYGSYKVIAISVERGADQTPLTARFGGIPLRWNKWVKVDDTPTQPIWSGRSELLERLLADECELCGSKQKIEVHHIHKLADLKLIGQSAKPQWVTSMAKRRRKTLIVCQKCHHEIHYGRYDGESLSK